MTMTTYHLFHHQLAVLSPAEVTDTAWFLNNATTFTVVAVIRARNPQEALQAAQLQAQQHPVPHASAIRTGNLLRVTLPGDVLVSEDGVWRVAAGETLQPLTLPESQPWKHFSHHAGINALAWSPDGSILAATENEGRVHLHVIASEDRFSHAYHMGHSVPTCLAWSPQGDRLATACYGGEVHLWRPDPWRHDGHRGSILVCWPDEEEGFSAMKVGCLAWSPDGEQILAGWRDGRLLGWQARTGAGLPSLLPHEQAITALAFSPAEEHLLLTASSDATVRIWHRQRDLEPLRVFPHHQPVTTAVWSPDGSRVASCEQQDPAISLWHVQRGNLDARLPLSVFAPREPEVLSLAWSPDGAYLAAGCDDGTIQIMDLRRYQHVWTYRYGNSIDRRERVKALTWSPDSAVLATNHSTTVLLWQVASDLAAAASQGPAVQMKEAES